jgi:hypothetical protein
MTKSEIGNGAHKVFLEDGDVVVVEIVLLERISKELQDAFILDARDFGRFDDLFF